MTSSSAKPERSFVLLPTSLTQLVDDRLDEEQYEQAVELLDQIRLHGVRPSQDHIRMLFALSLCSLAPEQLASTSQWTLDQQHQTLVAHALQQPVQKGHSALHSACRLSDRPSDNAVLQAAALIIKYSETFSSSGSLTEAQQIAQNAALSRHLLSCLPSYAPRTDLTGQAKHNSRSNESDREDMLGVSALARWVEDHLNSAEDIWDLLSHGHFSTQSSLSDKLGHVSEFWMNERDQKHYHSQILSEKADNQQLEDKMTEVSRCGHFGDSLENSSEEDTEDHPTSGIPRRQTVSKRRLTEKTSTKGKKQNKEPPTKKRRTAEHKVSGREVSRLRLTEGAWRTLSILLRLWEQIARCKSRHSGFDEEGSLLWQFKGRHLIRKLSTVPGRRSAPSSQEQTDQIDRALNVAMSFPQILAPYKTFNDNERSVLGHNEATNGLKRGDQRLISKVAQPELEHRQKVATRLTEKRTVERAQTASQLLAQMGELVRLNQIQSSAFVEGCADRLKSLTMKEIKYLYQPLIFREPMLTAKTLATYLQTCTMRHPDDLRSSSKGDLIFHYEGETLSLPSYFPIAVPLESDSVMELQGDHETHSESNAVLTFFKLNKTNLDAELKTAYPLTFPTRSEYLLTAKETDRDSKSGKTQHSDGTDRATQSDRTRRDKLKALAFIHFRHLQARNRVNELKFLVAKCLLRLVDDSSGEQHSLIPAVRKTPLYNADTWTDGSDSTASTVNEMGANKATQRSTISKLLGQLIKAYDKDCKEFTACLLAMKTHIGVQDLQTEEESRAKIGEKMVQTNFNSATLPSIQLTTIRSENLVNNTDKMAHASRIFREALSTSKINT